MSDLDDFFAKRLDEEASFPNRGKNWKQMSKRLEAFDSGVVQGNPSGLHLWQAAAVIAVATAGFLLWKTLTTQHYNKSLRQEVAALQTDRLILEGQLAAAEKRAANPTVEEGSNKDNHNSENIEIPPRADLKRTETAGEAQKLPTEKKSDKPARLADVQAENLPEETSKNFTGKQPPPTVLEEKASLPETAILPKNEPLLPDTSFAQPSDIALTAPPLDAVKNAPSKTDSLLVAEEKPRDSIASSPTIAQEIKPIRTAKNRFRIGAQATVGFVQPKQKGVTALRGQGFAVEAKVLRSLWVTASIDWLHHEVSTEEFVPRFHPHHDSLPKPPNGGHGGPLHPAKLVQVESAPREQHYGLGLRYELPVKFWLRPSLRVAHEWVRVSPTLVTYKFEEDNPLGPGGPIWHDHDPEYTAEKFDAQWLANQWRFGLGLEKDIPNWTFGLWADYSKDFSAATPSFDALYVRAGAQYRF